MKYAVLGAGEMGLALTNVLLDNKKDVILYSNDIKQTEFLNKYHKSIDKLKDLNLNGNIKASSSLEEVVHNADVLVLAVPSQCVKGLIEEVNCFLNHKVIIVNAAKGLDINLKIGMQEVIDMTINKEYLTGIISLLGPSFAREIVEKSITLICAVSKNEELAKLIQKDFSNDYLRLYVLTDVIGAEIGSSLKNVIAIASGILAGLGYKEDTKAAIITRGLIEIRKIGKLYGAHEETFFGLTGVGDLILTCNSTKSRNYTFGYKIGKENDAKKVIDSNTETVEGYYTLEAIKRVIDDNNLDLPIINGLYEVIYQGGKPSDVIQKIMNRPLKSERSK